MTPSALPSRARVIHPEEPVSALLLSIVLLALFGIALIAYAVTDSEQSHPDFAVGGVVALALCWLLLSFVYSNLTVPVAAPAATKASEGVEVTEVTQVEPTAPSAPVVDPDPKPLLTHAPLTGSIFLPASERNPTEVLQSTPGA